jgi:hypothetical protein
MAGCGGQLDDVTAARWRIEALESRFTVHKTIFDNAVFFCYD